MRRQSDQRWKTAIHEAGHAVVARHLGIRPRGVSIISDHHSHGRFLPRIPAWFLRETNEGVDSARALWYAAHAVTVMFAGPEAERRFAGRYNHRAAQTDYERALHIASSYCGSEDDTNAFLKWRRIVAQEFIRLTHIWFATRTLAQELIRRGDILGSDVCRSIDVAMTASTPRPK